MVEKSELNERPGHKRPGRPRKKVKQTDAKEQLYNEFQEDSLSDAERQAITEERRVAIAELQEKSLTDLLAEAEKYGIDGSDMSK